MQSGSASNMSYWVFSYTYGGGGVGLSAYVTSQVDGLYSCTFGFRNQAASPIDDSAESFYGFSWYTCDIPQLTASGAGIAAGITMYEDDVVGSSSAGSYTRTFTDTDATSTDAGITLYLQTITGAQTVSSQTVDNSPYTSEWNAGVAVMIK